MLLLLAFAALLPLALPAAATCVPLCTTPSAETGYVPPATVLDSGDTITFSSLDRAHTATEAGVAANLACMNVNYGPGDGAATLRVHDGALYAQQPLKTEKRCGTATALPDGSFALRYVCLFHSQMNGVLVVRPGA